MNLSYWEHKHWFSNVDFTIIGSGIVGLTCALNLQKRYKKARILVLERGMLPNGASTKNAGFACFGSLSEILHDLNTHTTDEVIQLITKRYQGLQLLRQLLGDHKIDYFNTGGYELFTKNDTLLFEQCMSSMKEINSLLYPIFNDHVFSTCQNIFNFKQIEPTYIFNRFEGQIDTGKMMETLLYKVQKSGVKILNNCEVLGVNDTTSTVTIETKNFSFSTNKAFIATNGFASQLGIKQVKPARAQILITDPIPNLKIKGTFHLDRGYYYFRNIDQRILLGGGRNLDIEGEETTTIAQTPLIQQKLEEILHHTILPDSTITIQHRWSGIMGVGIQKNTILKPLSTNLFCGVRQGGMGIAIGCLVGKELSDFV